MKTKNILSLSAVLLLSTACGIDKLPDTDIASPETSADNKSGTKSVVITASIGAPGTRITYTPDEEDIPGLNAEWEPGDKLGVVNCMFVPNWVNGGTTHYAPWLFSPALEQEQDEDSYYSYLLYAYQWLKTYGSIPPSEFESIHRQASNYVDYEIDISKYPLFSLTNVSPTAGAQATFSGEIPNAPTSAYGFSYLSDTSSGYIYYYPVVDRNRVSYTDVYIPDLGGGFPYISLFFQFGLTGQTVTIGTDGEIADHTLHHYNLMCSYYFEESKDDLLTRPVNSYITFDDDEVVHLHHLCALVSFDMPSVGVPVERIELECDQACFANSVGFDYLLRRENKVKTVVIDVTDNSDGSGRIKGYMTVSADAGVTGPFTVKVTDTEGMIWRSKDLYLSDSRGMEAGKCYTFKPTLHPPKFAASNIYWDGTQLTFDTSTQTDSDDDAVYFKWGSLIGISGDSEGIDGDTKIYTPIHSQPGQYREVNMNDDVYGFGTYKGIPGFDGEEFEFNQPTNNALLYKWGADDNYWSENNSDPSKRPNWYQGDICAFITQGKWRMPTEVDFSTSMPYTIDKENETITTKDGLYTFKSMDFRYAKDGELIGMGDGGYYWSGSVVKDNPKRSCLLYFDVSENIADTGDTDDRQQAFPVRCVSNVVVDD
jgi:hypothetical protein